MFKYEYRCVPDNRETTREAQCNNILVLRQLGEIAESKKGEGSEYRTKVSE